MWQNVSVNHFAYIQYIFFICDFSVYQFINVTTAATGFGLSVASDTLISQVSEPHFEHLSFVTLPVFEPSVFTFDFLFCIAQTYGNKNMKRVGVILQRSIIILLLFCLPCWAVLINSYQLLILLHQEEEVARYIKKNPASLFMCQITGTFVLTMVFSFQNRSALFVSVSTSRSSKCTQQRRLIHAIVSTLVGEGGQETGNIRENERQLNILSEV